MSDWLVYFCKAAWAWPVPLSVKLRLSLLLGLGQKGRLRGRVCFGQQNLDEGIPSIMVEKHGSKSMGNPGYVASSSQEAGRQKLAFCCLFKKCGTQPMKWYPLHTERSFSSQLNLSEPVCCLLPMCLAGWWAGGDSPDSSSYPAPGITDVCRGGPGT